MQQSTNEAATNVVFLAPQVERTGAESLAAAIAKLNAIAEDTGRVGWFRGTRSWGLGRVNVGRIDEDEVELTADTDVYLVASAASGIEADAIVTLRRTLDAQLEILEAALADAGGSHDEPGAYASAVALALAVLGDDS